MNEETLHETGAKTVGDATNRLTNGWTGNLIDYGTGGQIRYANHWANPPEPTPTISEAKEIEIREASIKYTIKMFGNNTEVGLDEFCKLMDAVHAYMRYGTKIKTNNN
jgi:hypothetical protein